MTTPDTPSQPRTRRRPLERAARLRIVGCVVFAVVLPAVVLQGGDSPFYVAAAAGCALLLLLTAVQSWHFGTVVGRVSWWDVALLWAVPIVMILLLVLAFTYGILHL